MATTGFLKDRIRRLRAELKLNQTIFGERVGVTQGQVSKWENGEDDPNHEHQVVLAELAKKSLHEFLGRRASRAEAVEVPIVGFVGAGAEVYPDDSYEKGGGFAYEPLPPPTDGKLIGVEVRGDSMFPAAEDGWRIIYTGEQIFIESDVLNRLCVVALRDGRMLVKKVARGSQKNRFHLVSTNAPLIEDAEILWAARVRAIIPR